MNLDFDTLRNAVAGGAAAFRCATDYQPAGGEGDKIFPPTYKGGKYATEERMEPATGEIVTCVLLDSVQSQANRMELALLDSHRRGRIQLPLMTTRFDQQALLKKFEVSSLEAPHRVADALFRDSLFEGTIFRKSEKGRVLDHADVRNATGLFGLCPTALVFGIWDSTGPRGGLGAKFQRAIVSEIVGYRAVPGVKTGSRIDPAQIMLGAGPVYENPVPSTDKPDWTLEQQGKAKKLGKDGKGKPSEANHGNVTPTLSAGGFTIRRAVQTTTISLSAVRRLRFPLGDSTISDPQVDSSAHTLLAALALLAGTLARQDVDLRSRCHLFAQSEPTWDLLDRPGSVHNYTLDAGQAVALFNEAAEAARAMGLPWEGEILLTPSDELVELVRRSQVLAAESGTGED
ncbi:MAG: type I-U CRISPR-associated protein Cas7 [Chromatiales bacterium]|nr:type I-U CRISPR-associated protein Cas7 [Chromatiales bacterium]